MPIDIRTDKEPVVHMYNRLLFSHKKKCIQSVLMRWVNLQLFIQSEASQKEKNKYHILTHICGIYKDGTEKAVCKALMEMQTERTDLLIQA